MRLAQKIAICKKKIYNFDLPNQAILPPLSVIILTMIHIVGAKNCGFFTI